MERQSVCVCVCVCLSDSRDFVLVSYGESFVGLRCQTAVKPKNHWKDHTRPS
jgi:hypothetical protein